MDDKGFAMEQTMLFDFLAPDYGGCRDEIRRASIETDFANKIVLQKCCGQKPVLYFKSCHEYFVKCSVCGSATKMHKKEYIAMQSWNRGERVADDK